VKSPFDIYGNLVEDAFGNPIEPTWGPKKDSATYRESSWRKETATDEGPKKLPFRLLHEVISNVPPDPPWFWDGYLAPSSLTLLAGRPKVGKSTFLFALLQAVNEGAETFLGRALGGGAALLLTEERERTLADKARLIGDETFLPPQGIPKGGGKKLHVLMHHEANGVSWPEIVFQAQERCRANDLGLLIVDTLPQWSPLGGDGENAAGAVLEQLLPIQTAAGDGLAVLLVSHQRKSFGEFGEAVRGSNALTGGVDIVLELERAPSDMLNGDGLRVLRAVSRFSSTPAELVIQLTEEGYEACGDMQGVREQEEQKRLLAHLEEHREPTTDEISQALEIPAATVRRRLEALESEGKVKRYGEGKRGNPYRWTLASEEPLSPTHQWLLDTQASLEQL
jgi:DNA-binding transcriptional ArsR family regulator